MADIHILDVETTLDLPVDRVLDGAKDCERVIVIGVTPDGDYHFASSLANRHTILWDIEQCKRTLMDM